MLEKEKEETSFKKPFSKSNDITWYQSIGLTICFGVMYVAAFGNPFASSLPPGVDRGVTVMQSPGPAYLENANQKITYDIVLADFKSSVDSSLVIAKNLDINKSEDELKKLIFNNTNLTPTYININKQTNVIEVGLVKNNNELFSKLTLKTNVQTGAVNLSFLNTDKEDLIVEHELEKLLIVVRENFGNKPYAMQWTMKPGNKNSPSSLDISMLSLEDKGVKNSKGINPKEIITKKTTSNNTGTEIKAIK